MGSEKEPVEEIFDFQRRYVEKGLENIKRGLKFHKETVEDIDLKESIESYNRNMEIAKFLTDSYLRRIEEILPANMNLKQQREFYDELYELFRDSNEKTTKVVEENLEDVLKAYTEMLDKNVEILDEQTESILKGLNKMEDQTIETVEETKEAIEIE